MQFGQEVASLSSSASVDKLLSGFYHFEALMTMNEARLQHQPPTGLCGQFLISARMSDTY